jgi:hypothetical protein
LKTVIKCAFEIAKNSFNMSEMRSVRIMHKKTGLLNRIRNIWTSVGDILKSTSKATIKTEIGNRITGGRQFGTCINGCMAWLTIAHASTRGIKNILALGEKKRICGTSD